LKKQPGDWRRKVDQLQTALENHTAISKSREKEKEAVSARLEKQDPRLRTHKEIEASKGIGTSGTQSAHANAGIAGK